MFKNFLRCFAIFPEVMTYCRGNVDGLKRSHADTKLESSCRHVLYLSIVMLRSFLCRAGQAAMRQPNRVSGEEPCRGVPCGAPMIFGRQGERQYLCNRQKEFHDKQNNLLII